MGISIEDIVAPGLGMITGKGFLGNVLGKKDEIEAEKQKALASAAEQKAAQEQAAAQANAQQWANRPAMKKGGSVKTKCYDDGGPVYTEKMGQPPKEPDDASVRKQSKKDQPEQPGSGIRVDGKPLKDNFPRQAAVIRQGWEDKAKAEMARDRDRADKGRAFKENAESGRTNAMGDTYKKGGSVSASSRADGMASRGKTRGKMC
jgi:hypothetical protein